MQITEEHRRQVTEEKAKSAMSLATAARLKKIGDADRQREEDQKKFIEQFNRLPKHTWTMVKLLERLVAAPEGNIGSIEKRALKLRYCLRRRR